MPYYVTNDLAVNRDAERVLADRGNDLYLAANVVTDARPDCGASAGEVIVYAQSRTGDPVLIYDNQPDDDREAIASDIGIDVSELDRLTQEAWTA